MEMALREESGLAAAKWIRAEQLDDRHRMNQNRHHFIVVLAALPYNRNRYVRNTVRLLATSADCSSAMGHPTFDTLKPGR